jgi:hypothetical protein
MNDWLEKHYPDQDYSGELGKIIIEYMDCRTTNYKVLELGGWDGRLAGEILERCPTINTWDNYEICRGLKERTVCDDSRYRLIVPANFIWDLSLDLTNYDMFVASHTIEHMSFAHFKRLMDEIHHIPILFLNIPFPKNGSWHNSTSLHVMEASRGEIIKHIKTKGYGIKIHYINSKEDTHILRFEK